MWESLKDFVIRYELMLYLLLIAAWAGTMYHLIMRLYPQRMREFCARTSPIECKSLVRQERRIWSEIRLYAVGSVVATVLLVAAVWTISET